MQSRLLISKIKKLYDKYLEYDADQLKKETLDLGFESRTHGNLSLIHI